MGVLDGKVVLVTGGGNGIGKECALIAAREGASVLVNDLGGGLKGDDDAGSAGPAAEVAAEIRAAGGKAASNSDSVTNYDAVVGMVEQAKKEFGGLHAVINPAGILRDVMFHKMSEADWDKVIDVHLKGSFNVARATIANTDGLWRPGSAVKARITVEQQPAPLVVPLAALQRFRDWDVVFIRIDDTYEIRPVELGKRDARQVEVLTGLSAGDPVVVEQSYLVKADIEKSGASHDH